MTESRANLTLSMKREKASAALPLGLVDLAMLAVVLIWGGNFVLTKWTLSEVRPLAFNGLRFVLSSTLLLSLVALTEKGLHVEKRDWPRLILLGLVGGTLHQIFFIVGLDLTRAGNSSLLLSTNPIFIALLSALLGFERITRRMWLGIALSFGGIALIVANSGQGLGIHRQTLLGDGITLLSALCWAIFAVLSRPLVRRYQPLKVTALTAAVATPFLVLAGLPELLTQDWTAVTWRGWAGLLASTILSLSLAYVIYFQAVRVIGNARTAVYDNLVPVVALGLAALVLGETPNLWQLLGAAVILIGVFLARAERS